jgi:hypothetical protein
VEVVYIIMDFHGDSDDWFYQLFQTRVYPAGGSTTYGGGSVGDIGAILQVV